MDKYRKIDILENLNIPKEYWYAHTRHVSDDAIKQRIKYYFNNIGYLSDKGSCIVVRGPLGCGKSSIASILLKAAAFLTSRDGLFIECWDYRMRVLNRNIYDTTYNISFQETAKGTDVLVLDNITIQDVHNKAIGIYDIGRLIRHRSSNKKITIITSSIEYPVWEEDDLLKSFITDIGRYVDIWEVEI